MEIYRWENTIRAVANQVKDQIAVDPPTIPILRLREQHPKLAYMSRHLVKRLLFKDPKRRWIGLNPQRRWKEAQRCVYRVKKVEVLGATMTGIVGSFVQKSKSSIYKCSFGFQNKGIHPKNFEYSCTCPMGRRRTQSGYATLCKHVIAMMLDTCPDFDTGHGAMIVNQYVKAKVGKELVEVERILYRRERVDRVGYFDNLSQLAGRSMEDAIFIKDEDFQSQEAHMQYKALIDTFNTGIVSAKDLRTLAHL